MRPFSQLLRSFLVAGALATGSEGALVINEIHYDPDVKTEPVEFIELHNTDPAPADLSGWSISGGVDFAFPAGTTVPGGGFLVISQDPEAFQRKFKVPALGPWTGKLNNDGDEILLKNLAGQAVDRVDYGLGFPWPTTGDAPGCSIELIHPDLDNDLGGSWRSSGSIVSLSDAAPAASSPTPGRRNSVFSEEAPPQIRQVDHHPRQPRTEQEVLVTAKITDPDGVETVTLDYQIVEPGDYIAVTDPAFAENWSSTAMNDEGQYGDAQPGDSIYTGRLPSHIQTHRRLIRYRIHAWDRKGRGVSVPYPDDPQPNFAYFVYDGLPPWSGAIRPGSTGSQGQAVVYDTNVLGRLPVYHLVARKEAVEAATWTERYGGNDYKWHGALVYNGRVWDHIRFRARGGVWRYAMGKNMWKFDFNRGHDFEPVDNFGRPYSAGWNKLNLGACIQQGDYLHRGEQGMFESVGFRLFNLAGVESPKTHFVHFRIIDAQDEIDPSSQYQGDFWGLYLAVEQEGGRFLEEHGLPDGNLYKMENGTGELNNQGPTAATDKSDLNSFLSSIYGPAKSDTWWRANLDLERYYSYRTIVEAIHHYDIGYGKNYFFYLNPETGRWSTHPWDLDLTWANNMYGNGEEPFRARILSENRTDFVREYKNRVREIRDLLFNEDQAYQLIDEYAAMIDDPDGAPSFVDADRALWDYHPIMTSRYVNASKAGQGRFYKIAPTRDFPGMVALMKAYVVERGGLLDQIAADPLIPEKPVVTFAGPAGFQSGQLLFRVSPYDGVNPFAAVKWRLAEVAPPGGPPYDPANPRKYEIEALWESGELTTYNDSMAIPAGAVASGRTYRVRARMKDTTARWSHWSDPVEFTTAQIQAVADPEDDLVVTEVMYNPPAGNEFEFLEFRNSHPTAALDLSGLTFTEGIEYAFPPGTIVPPSGFVLVTRANPANNFAAFRTHYGLGQDVLVVGPFGGGLNNDGEEIVLSSADGLDTILSFDYGDGVGWPASADGAGHSLVPVDQGDPENLDYPGDWRASAYIKGSPGALDPELPRTVVINETVTHTDYFNSERPEYDSNDWIELFNTSQEPVNITGWYLSDDAADLRKWAIPNTTVPAEGFVVFDEVTGFHNPITTGFGLNKAGEELFLSYLPGGPEDRVVDSVNVHGLANNRAWARFPDGGAYWRETAPTPAAANSAPTPSLVISEIMYHPSPTPANPEDNTADEFIKISNPGSAPVNLFGPDGIWRLDGGVAFTFPANTVLAAGASLLVVSFNPANATAAAAFRARYGIGEDVPIFGPYDGRLSNSSDRVALEQPQAPDAPQDPISWIIVDQITYSDQRPWPSAADGEGLSLHRENVSGPGDDPANWSAKPPLTEGGGTEFRIESVQRVNGNLEIRFTPTAGRTYTLQYREVTGGDWVDAGPVSGPPVNGVLVAVAPIDPASPGRLYRLVMSGP